MHLRKLINTFYEIYPEKSIVISLSLDSLLPMAKLIVPKEEQPKQKCGRPNKGANKRNRN